MTEVAVTADFEIVSKNMFALTEICFNSSAIMAN